MRRTPIRRRLKHRLLPGEVTQKIAARSGHKCEWCRGTGGIVGLQHAHIVHHKMGGRSGETKKIINDPRNIAHLCGTPCHDILDNRIFKPDIRKRMLSKLKEKIGWNEWARENNRSLNGH